jgi:hypothetical protein
MANIEFIPVTSYLILKNPHLLKANASDSFLILRYFVGLEN